jgi:hypothetical protein
VWCARSFSLDSDEAASVHYSTTYALGNPPELINQKLVLLRRKQDAHIHIHACRTLNNFASRYKVSLQQAARRRSLFARVYICTRRRTRSQSSKLQYRKPHLCMSAELSYFPCTKKKARSLFASHIFLHTRASLRARAPERRIANWRGGNQKTGKSSNKAALIRARRSCALGAMLSVRRYMRSAQIPRTSVYICVYGFCIFEREQICAKQSDSRVS